VIPRRFGGVSRFGFADRFGSEAIGVNLLRMDGTVSFISESVDAEVWRRAALRRKE